MARNSIMTKARRTASLIGAVLLTYASLWCVVIATLLFLGLWLHILYFTGLTDGLDVSVPLQNFTRRINLSIPTMTPFQFDSHDDIDLDLIRMAAFTLYGTVVALSMIIFPQLIGGLLLLKATDLDIAPKVAYNYACRHQITQCMVCSIEIVLLVLLGSSFVKWPEVQTPRSVMGFLLLLLLVIIRFYLMAKVEKYIHELWCQMGNEDAQFEYKRMGKKAGGKKKEAKVRKAKLGRKKMNVFTV